MPQQQSSAAPVVLIVENDVLLRLVTASNLRDAGFEVLEQPIPLRQSTSWIVSLWMRCFRT
jgi:hypothetical protein